MASERAKLDITELGLNEKERTAGTVSFDEVRTKELRDLWSDAQRLQNELYNARTKYYDKKLGGDSDRIQFTNELNKVLVSVRTKLNRSIAKLLRETNIMRNEVVRNDNMLEEQDRLIKEATIKIMKLKDKIKEQKKSLINKKVINELYNSQPAFSNEYIFHIVLTSISIVIFFFIINK